MKPSVTDIRFTEAGRHDQRDGLLGYVSFLLEGSVRVDGVAVRMTRDGRRTLSFPAKRTARGVEHPFVRPISTASREAIEAQVFAAIDLRAESRP